MGNPFNITSTCRRLPSRCIEFLFPVRPHYQLQTSPLPLWLENFALTSSKISSRSFVPSLQRPLQCPRMLSFAQCCRFPPLRCVGCKGSSPSGLLSLSLCAYWTGLACVLHVGFSPLQPDDLPPKWASLDRSQLLQALALYDTQLRMISPTLLSLGFRVLSTFSACCMVLPFLVLWCWHFLCNCACMAVEFVSLSASRHVLVALAHTIVDRRLYPQI